MAAVTCAYARGTGPTHIAVLLALGLVNAGLVWMAEQVWQPWRLSHEGPRLFWPLLAVLTGLLLAGPLLSLLGQLSWPNNTSALC